MSGEFWRAGLQRASASLMDIVLPPWSRWLIAAAAGVTVYMLGVLHGERIAGQRHTDYLVAEAAHSSTIAQAQTRVVLQTEIKYRDRIKTVYVKGEEIERQVPVYVTRDDDDRYGVNAGFVRSYNAAWAGETAGAAADSDRDAAGIPLSEVAEVNAHNATACLAWRELAIGLRDHYEGLKEVTK